MRKMVGTLALVAALTLGVAVLVGHGEEPKKDNPKADEKQVKELMHKKLDAAQKVLEGPMRRTIWTRSPRTPMSCSASARRLRSGSSRRRSTISGATNSLAASNASEQEPRTKIWSRRNWATWA